MALESSVRRALGDWLGERLLSCRRDRAVLELEFAGSEAAREAEALQGELLAALRRRLGPEAPARIRIASGPGLSPRLRKQALAGAGDAGEPGPETLRALEGIEDEALRERLARIAGRGTRA